MIRIDRLANVEFLQHEKLLTGEVERLELEELQGVGGLKALRIGVQFHEPPASEPKKRVEQKQA